MRKYDMPLAYLGLSAGAAALFEATFYSIYLAAALGAASALIFAALFQKSSEGRISRDVPVFVEGMLSELKAGHSLIAAMERANSPKLSFSGEVGASIERYRMSLDPDYSFGALMDARSERLRSLAALLISAMDSGAPARAFLGEFDSSKSRGRGLSHKADATFGSSTLISAMGSMVFFPVFAGVSTGILGALNGPSELQLGGASLMFALFIVVSNYYGFRHSGSGRIEAYYRFALASLFALLVMRVVSLASISMI